MNTTLKKFVNVTVTNSSYKVVANIYNFKLDNKEYPVELNQVHFIYKFFIRWS
jgi:hypothetical protein